MTAHREFPRLPQWFTAGTLDRCPSEMRSFGASRKDLEVAFRLARRPEIVTELLSLCYNTAAGAVDREVWLQMPIGMRIEALLCLASLSDGRPFAWSVRCDSASCSNGKDGYENEFQLTLDQILSVADEQRERQTETIPIGDIEATIRRPTAVDQMQWLEQSTEAQSELMLRSILVRPTLEQLLETEKHLETIAAAVDDAMDAFDPVLGFHVKVLCPRCGAAKDVWPDLAGAALERLSAAQRRAIEDVHRLALRYHWSETEILELPEWRRQSYLELIEAEAQ
jgi:hypothetical protein